MVEGGAVDGSGMKMSIFICYLGQRMTFWCEYITITPAGFLEKRRLLTKTMHRLYPLKKIFTQVHREAKSTGWRAVREESHVLQQHHGACNSHCCHDGLQVHCTAQRYMGKMLEKDGWVIQK